MRTRRPRRRRQLAPVSRRGDPPAAEPGGDSQILLGQVAQQHDSAEPGEDLDHDEPSFFAELKADPGKLGLETLLAEITKLKRVRATGYQPAA